MTLQLETADYVGLGVAATGLFALGTLLWRAKRGRSLFPPHPQPFLPSEEGAADAGRLAIWFLLLFGAYMVASALIVFVGGVAGVNGGIAIAILAAAAIYDFVLRPQLRPQGSPGRLVGLGLFAMWASLPLVVFTFLLFRWLGLPSQQVVEQIRNREEGWVGLVALATLVAPIVEEVAFRGLLYGALRSLRGPRVAIALSSVLFAMIHPPATWLPLFILALFLGRLVESTGSLLPCVAAHMAFNLLNVAPLLFF